MKTKDIIYILLAIIFMASWLHVSNVYTNNIMNNCNPNYTQEICTFNN